MRTELLSQEHDGDLVARLPTGYERAELERRARLREQRAVFLLGVLVGVGLVVAALAALGGA